MYATNVPTFSSVTALYSDTLIPGKGFEKSQHLDNHAARLLTSHGSEETKN